MPLIALLAAAALATDIVWVGGVPDHAAEIAGAVEASPVPLLEVDLRSARTRATVDDARALRDLEGALEQARRFEAKLDGELSILELTEPLVANVTLVRNANEAAALFRALAYQGFAVSRYYGDTLGTDDSAAPWRVEVSSRTVERPWVDAMAIDRARAATAYDIAEAPQRILYNQRREELGDAASLLAELPALPPGASVYVDGQAVVPGPGRVLALFPGRHHIHAELDDRVIERWDVRLHAPERVPLEPVVDQAAFDAFLAGLAEGQRVPTEIAQLLDALDEPAFFATAGPSGVQVFDPASGVLREVRVHTGDTAVGLEAYLGGWGGWVGSDDFYLQDPSANPATFATVNAISIGAYAGADLVFGVARIGAGVDLLVPLGGAHTARSGADSVRPRPIPHLAVGTRWAQATAGWMFPYHVVLGLRGQVPLGGPLEGRISAWYGPEPRLARSDGTFWHGHTIVSVSAGIGVRL